MNPEFFFTSLIVVLIPGTGVIYTVTTGLTLKWRAALAAAFGCTLGIVPHIIASILGLSALMNMSAQVFALLKLVGAVYLLYLAWQMWREAGTLELNQQTTDTSFKQIVLRAITINLLNPKLTIFFFAFLPLFTTEDSASPMLEMVALSAIFMSLTFIVFAGYGIMASAIRTYLMNSAKAVKRLQRTFAVLLAGFAVELALSEN